MRQSTHSRRYNNAIQSARVAIRTDLSQHLQSFESPSYVITFHSACASIGSPGKCSMASYLAVQGPNMGDSWSCTACTTFDSQSYYFSARCKAVFITAISERFRLVLKLQQLLRLRRGQRRQPWLLCPAFLTLPSPLSSLPGSQAHNAMTMGLSISTVRDSAGHLYLTPLCMQCSAFLPQSKGRSQYGQPCCIDCRALPESQHSAHSRARVAPLLCSAAPAPALRRA